MQAAGGSFPWLRRAGSKARSTSAAARSERNEAEQGFCQEREPGASLSSDFTHAGDCDCHRFLEPPAAPPARWLLFSTTLSPMSPCPSVAVAGFARAWCRETEAEGGLKSKVRQNTPAPRSLSCSRGLFSNRKVIPNTPEGMCFGCRNVHGTRGFSGESQPAGLMPTKPWSFCFSQWVRADEWGARDQAAGGTGGL